MKYYLIRNKNLFHGLFNKRKINKRNRTNTKYYFENRNRLKTRQLKQKKKLKRINKRKLI